MVSFEVPFESSEAFTVNSEWTEEFLDPEAIIRDVSRANGVCRAKE